MFFRRLRSWPICSACSFPDGATAMGGSVGDERYRCQAGAARGARAAHDEESRDLPLDPFARPSSTLGTVDVVHDDPRRVDQR